MVVCKFFLDNRCRFGSNCRFEHPDGGGGVQRQLRFDSGPRDPSVYKWSAKQNNVKNDNQLSSPEELISTLSSTLEQGEQMKMWPFSCIALEKDMPCIPGFIDYAADELRWEAYQAMKGGGNLMAYTEKIKQLTNDYSSKKQLLKNPSRETKQKLVEFVNSYRQDKNTESKSSFVKPSAFGSSSSSTGMIGGLLSSGGSTGSTFGAQSSSSSIFGGQSSFGGTTANSGGLFGGQSSFGGQSTTGAFSGQSSSTFGGTSSTSAFGASGSTTFGSQSAAGSIFSNAAKGFGQSSTSNPGTTFGQGASQSSIFGQSAPVNPASGSGFGQTGLSSFGQQPQTQSTGFGQSTTGGAFGQPMSQAAPSSVFGQTPNTLFGKTQVQPAATTSSIFGSSGFGTSGSSAFGSSAAPSGGASLEGQTTNHKSTVYTPLSELTADERAQFEADQFTSGRIPVKPPPRELIK